MIGRTIWFGALAVLAVLTALLQIDKQSEAAPALAQAVPSPLRDYAQTHVTLAALEAGDAAAALTEAERLVRRRPVPAEYLSLLAVAQARAGRAEQAAMTIQIAAQRGWREPLAQETLLKLALSAGDTPEAARRYTALLLSNKVPDSLLTELGPEVLGTTGSAGRAQMADIVTGGQRWHNHFLRRGQLVMPPDAFTEIAIASMSRGARFNCANLARAIKSLSRKDPASAEALESAAKGQCP